MAEPFGTFAALKNQSLVNPEGNSHFLVDKNFMIALMSKRLSAIKFDENWYLAKNPDVKEALSRGIVTSAKDHYVLSGYYEHRMPFPIIVNEKWYLQAYPDVAEAIQKGVYKSGQAHFDVAGYREGRLPFENFQL